MKLVILICLFALSLPAFGSASYKTHKLTGLYEIASCNGCEKTATAYFKELGNEKFIHVTILTDSQLGACDANTSFEFNLRFPYSANRPRYMFYNNIDVVPDSLCGGEFSAQESRVTFGFDKTIVLEMVQKSNDYQLIWKDSRSGIDAVFNLRKSNKNIQF